MCGWLFKYFAENAKTVIGYEYNIHGFIFTSQRLAENQWLQLSDAQILSWIVQLFEILIKVINPLKEGF